MIQIQQICLTINAYQPGQVGSRVFVWGNKPSRILRELVLVSKTDTGSDCRVGHT